jgi:hypothetical protein
MDAWSVSCKLFQKSTMDGPSFINLMEGILLRGNEEEVQLFAGISCLLWLHRNDMIHEGRFTHPNVLVQMARKKIADFSKVWQGSGWEKSRIVSWRLSNVSNL